MKRQRMNQITEKFSGLVRRTIRNVWQTGFCLFVTVVSLSACGSPFSPDKSPKGQQERPVGETASKERADTGFIVTNPDSYDSADTPVITGINKDDNTVTFLNAEVGRKYTLSLDGTTKMYDRHGESIALDQIQIGDIVDITFLKSKKHLTTMQLSAKAWINYSVEKYEINTVRGEVTIGQEVFKLNDNTQYLSEGRTIDGMDLNEADILSFRGIDKEVLSVTVEKGHGYLRLANDENFVGGWIEIGQSLIRRITEDMLLTVPEGSYQVNISHNGNSGIKSVVINRNEETTLDIGDLEVAEPKSGTILFSLSPTDARLYIDGAEVDASQPVTLEYGIHQLIAKAGGYQTVTRYLRVGSESAGFDVILDPVKDEDEENSKSSTGSKSSESSKETDTVTDYYKVYVDSPEGAEVYLDGNYVGISPCSFRKNAGSHVITLRKSGYETRSYTVQIDSEEKNATYSFANLEKSTAESSGKESSGTESTGTSSAEGSSASSSESSSKESSS